MSDAIQFPGENQSNAARAVLRTSEPLAQRTYTPTQAVFSKSAGSFHFTPEGRRLYDYSSGVLVANLGHNPRKWMQHFCRYLGWRPEHVTGEGEGDYFEAVTLTSYNAVTEIEVDAAKRLLASMRSTASGAKLDTVLWAASGSEAVQKALWACLHRDEERDLILATRHGFHGKKGLAGACTGSEKDRDRDPRVKFISFPMDEVDDFDKPADEIDLSKYQGELDALWSEHGRRINCLITEPYLGGGGSYHPPSSYLQMLQEWCAAHDVMFILDEVQSNFGRTGSLYAYEKHQIQPDFVCLGKGMGNGIPVNAAVGRSDVLSSLRYGEGSDTWSAAPTGCAAVLATLDVFENSDVMENTARLCEQFVAGLRRLKETGLIGKFRGEGMVFGIECVGAGDLSAEDVANEIVKAAYLGRDGGDGIHLLGPLAGKVIRVSPPMTMTQSEAEDSLNLLHDVIADLAGRIDSTTPVTA
ncbi:MAG: aminotransferase class III-fold pyridoxal phosphate-dependent enzyme [Planctomycetota bacterium]|nr:MAG: aminotransferase class III-fold pyridoxal phosphate-dependent enzyme [Planctomycetota bacterium]